MVNSLKTIYPRFGFHPFVAEVARKSLAFHGESQQSSWPYPNRASALSAQKFCQRKYSDCSSKIKCPAINFKKVNNWAQLYISTFT